MTSDLLATLASFSDPARIVFAQKTFPTQLRVIGVNNPNLRQILREIKATVKGRPAKEIISLAHDFHQQGVFELHWLAYELLGRSKKTLRALTSQDIDQLNTRIDNWVLTDVFCGKILGFAWQSGLLDDTYFLALQQSEDVWQRRIAVVATTALNTPANGGQGAPNRTLLLCQGAVTDHHPMITKAVSWALRSLIKWDRTAVEDFLQTHEDQLASLVVREVHKKLTTGHKN